MARPDWFNAATKNWVPQMGHDYAPWTQEAQSKIGQQWYRSPSWGGHVIYNPQYGFQDLRKVQDFYLGWDQAGTPNFSKAFSQAGFQKQLSNVGDWTQYYNDPEHAHITHQQKLAMYSNAPPTGQYQWGSQQPQATPTYGTQSASSGNGMYSPRYGSNVAQFRGGGRSGTTSYGATETSTGKTPYSPGRYYGTAPKKKTSMRYGYKPSM